MMKDGKRITHRQRSEVGTIRTMREEERLRRQKPYGVFGFLRSQFQTQGGSNFRERFDGDVVILFCFGYRYKSQWDFRSLVPLGALICEMIPCLLEVTGVFATDE